MINYVTGDATNPMGDGHKIITHVCNDIGGWGRGFVVALSNKWSQPEKTYRQCATQKPLKLGQVMFVNVEPDITVANMIAQHDVRTINGLPPVRYEALSDCLQVVSSYALTNNASIHMPRIGCGLAGGQWIIVENIINKTMLSLQIYVYDLQNNPIQWK